tara:strand:+ start:931 stop:1491 length:561 start_codon:yes stop_codon:yes gene_type:complete
MNYIDKYLKESAEVANMQIELKKEFLVIAEAIRQKTEKDGCVFFCGNGGSAADSQHLAAELVGRFKKNRRALKSIALTTDTSIITSIGNDYSYDDIFSRQLEAMASENDVLIAISTSGESQNVLKAVKYANSKNMLTVGFTNKNQNSLSKLSKYSLNIPSEETGIVQQGHITFGQLLCFYLEENIA